MQVLIVVTRSDNRHNQCSWNQDAKVVDRQAVGKFVREIKEEVEPSGEMILAVHVFTGGSCSIYSAEHAINNLMLS